MVRYRHTQVGTLVLLVLSIPIVVLGLVTVLVDVDRGVPAILGLLLIAVLLFGTLTVEVRSEALVIWFGLGVIRRVFLLSAVSEVRIVKNEPRYGWGIRKLPAGWLYSVSGLDAIEIETTAGDRHRVGTDQPRELLAAIREALARVTS